MVTAQQVFELALDLIEERLDSGAISPSDTISYKVRTPGILTTLQAELIKEGDLFNTYEISNYPVRNLLGNQFRIEPFEDEDLIFECDGVAKSYYFEVDRSATVYIEDFAAGSWHVLDTITAVPTESGFTAYKGLVSPTTGASKCRMRFSGSYYYRTVNRALFGASFATTDDIPNYMFWVPYELPSDFKSLHEVVEEIGKSYHQAAGYKFEGRNKLFINYFLEGKIRIVYRPVPSIVSLPSPIGDPISTVMQLDDVTCITVLPYGLAAMLMLQENPSVASYFNARFEELKRSALKSPSAFEPITNLYGGI